MTSLSGDSDNSGSTAEPHSLVCARCGTTAAAPQPLWICSVEHGRRHYFCENCTRENLRAIEGRLDSAWW
ncbi:hypothetical protein [Streptomyces scabiei]|uniref:hypothetical protein n=1 Tax=Streptomyces scabiei TaxID=1930 RepID=UPI00298F96C8|nr:hypothetical protein [Streptomyces scabiei]MDW8804820.1 hypothetical protein [Streptomyces scabiei]MDX3516820.1 hypothetical protein [Streptomyces scabiei]